MADENVPKFSIVKLIPATAVLTVFAQTYTSMYYKHFGFNPFPYLDPYEIVASAIQDFIMIGFFLIVYAQIVILYIVPIAHRWDVMNRYRNRRSRPNGKLRNSIYLYVLFFIAFGAFCYTQYDTYGSIYESVVAILMMLVLTLITYNRIKFKNLEEDRPRYHAVVVKYFPSIDPYLAYATFLVFGFIYTTASFDAKKMLKNNPTKGSQMVVNESKEVIKSTTKVIFIGQSSKYTFVYNTPDSTVRVVNKDQLSKMVWKTTNKNGISKLLKRISL
ncbi:MAG: hypothetical protein EOO85_30355 [Pedobacter sp.]|nr:MAG: hypothetical protein EOO85_30355 [Pedobacter sp.]